MAASKLSSCLAMAIAAAAMPTLSNRAYADGGGFRFSPFSSSSSSSAPKDPSSSGKSESEAEEPRGSGMDPEALERAAKALREINNSKNSKQVFFLLLKFNFLSCFCFGNRWRFYCIIKKEMNECFICMCSYYSYTHESRFC